MEEGRKRSIVLFLILGVFFVGGILFAFLVLPNMNRTLGNSDLRISLPLDRLDLRVVDKGIGLFCKNKEVGMEFEVREGSRVSAVKDGVVKEVEDSRVVIDVGESMEVEYFNLSRVGISVGDYVLDGDTVGFVDGSKFVFGVRDTKERVYLCPYVYFNDDGKKVVNGELDKMEYFDSICLCESLKY
ncbi:MAG: M23 family metallopeptidase [Candidatus Dojkabacteria bacterium]